MLYQTLQVPLKQQTYPVYIGAALLSQPELFSRHIQGEQVLIVSQKNIAALYLETLKNSLKAYDCSVAYLPQGERYKTLKQWQRLLDQLVAEKHERSTTLLALGGGMVGDMAGFAAAAYLRGVSYLQIPTSLIAQVDAAVGGKTGVNHPAGKNLIGAFHQPAAVLVDIKLLKSLPKRELIAGFAEVIKYGCIADRHFFEWLEENHRALLQGDEDALLQAISTCLSIKAQIVAEDCEERGTQRRLLNFGHTLGHALEATFDYKTYLHGEAVALGMKMAAHLSVALGYLSCEDERRLQALSSAFGLPQSIGQSFELKKLFSHLGQDKKMKREKLQWIILKAVGEAGVAGDIEEEELIKALPY